MLVERHDMIDQRDCADIAEPADPTEPIDNQDANEPIDPTLRNEPIDPIERTDPFDAIDRSESSDHSDHREVATRRSCPTSPFWPPQRQGAPDRRPALIGACLRAHGVLIVVSCDERMPEVSHRGGERTWSRGPRRVVVAGQRVARARRALLLGLAAGISFGVSAALTKTFVRLLGQGVFSVLQHWEPYALAAATLGGLLLAQSSFQAGSLSASIAALEVAEPVVAAAIGIGLLDEHVKPRGAAYPLAIGLALVGMFLGVLTLSRSTVFEDGPPGQLSPVRDVVDPEPPRRA